MRSGAVDHPAARNLIGLLPQILFIDASDAPRAERMQSVFRLMAAEAREFQPGGEAVITRLADILVIEALRAWIETAPAAQAGWLGALHDRQIGHALALIHREPARRGCHGGAARRPARLPLGGCVRTRVQARHRRVAGAVERQAAAA